MPRSAQVEVPRGNMGIADSAFTFRGGPELMLGTHAYGRAMLRAANRVALWEQGHPRRRHGWTVMASRLNSEWLFSTQPSISPTVTILRMVMSRYYRDAVCRPHRDPRGVQRRGEIHEKRNNTNRYARKQTMRWSVLTLEGVRFVGRQSQDSIILLVPVYFTSRLLNLLISVDNKEFLPGSPLVAIDGVYLYCCCASVGVDSMSTPSSGTRLQARHAIFTILKSHHG